MNIQNKKIKYLVRKSWSVSWPMTIIMSFIFLIGLADVYVAGYFGKDIKAAYGLAYQLYFIFSIVGMAYTVGLVSIIAKLFTSGKREELDRAVYSCLVTIAIVGCVIQIVAFAIGGKIIEWLHVPESIRAYAISFVRLYSLGLLFYYVMLSTNGILRATGMIKKSLFTMFIVCVANVGGNFLFSFHTPLGYRGIAVSTVLSLFLGGLLNMRHLFGRFLSAHFGYSFDIVKKIFQVAWPVGFLHILWQLGAIALFLILGRLPEHNVEIMAAFTNGLRVEAAIFLPAFAFNMANAVIIGNLLGKKREDDAFRAGLINTVVGVSLVTVLTLMVMANARFIAEAISQERVVASESIRYMFVAFLFEPIMAWGIILAGALSGAGDTKTVMIITALSIWLVRIPLSYVFGILLGYGAMAVWWSMNLSILAQTIFLSRRYFSKNWLYFSRKPVIPIAVER